jgi:hypothetical protein
MEKIFKLMLALGAMEGVVTMPVRQRRTGCSLHSKLQRQKSPSMVIFDELGTVFALSPIKSQPVSSR